METVCYFDESTKRWYPVEEKETRARQKALYQKIRNLSIDDISKLMAQDQDTYDLMVNALEV